MSWRSISSEILLTTIVLKDTGDKIYLNEAVLLDNELKIDASIDFIDASGDNYNTIDDEDDGIVDTSFGDKGYFNKCITVDVVDVISKYHNITQLDISHNNIKEIPMTIEKLSNLKSLDISHNWLEEIPHQMCNLINLKRLNLSNNDIKAFVWYNQTLGLPMYGWNKWYLKDTLNSMAKCSDDVDYYNQSKTKIVE
jgi:Leucine-rich repeat (LRR) protein